MRRCALLLAAGYACVSRKEMIDMTNDQKNDDRRKTSTLGPITRTIANGSLQQSGASVSKALGLSVSSSIEVATGMPMPYELLDLSFEKLES